MSSNLTEKKVVESAPILEFVPSIEAQPITMNSFIELTDELVEQIDKASEKIQYQHKEALAKIEDQRRKQLETIEQQYIKDFNAIGERFTQLLLLERKIRNNLLLETNKLLANSQVICDKDRDLKTAMESIQRDLWQLRWLGTNKIAKAPSEVKVTDEPSKEHQGFSKIFTETAANSGKSTTEWIGGWAKEASSYRRTTFSVAENKRSKVVLSPEKKKSTNTVAKPSIRFGHVEKVKKLVNLFVSEVSTTTVTDYLKRFIQTSSKNEGLGLTQIACVILSLLIAGKKKSIELMVQRYMVIVKYCVDQHIRADYMILIAIQVFIANSRDLDHKTIVPYLLCLFIEQGYIRQTTLLDWYEHGTYGKEFIGFDLAHAAASAYMKKSSDTSN